MYSETLFITITSLVLIIFLFLIAFYKKPIEFLQIIQSFVLKVSGYRFKSLSTNAGKVDYYEGGEGKTIILIHGFMVSAVNWVNIAPKLRKKYHVIIPNLPGHGTSPWPVPNNLEQFGNITIDFLLEMSKDKPVTLIGNSMGGGIAFKFALAYPERVENLIIINSAGLRWKMNKTILLPKNRKEALYKLHNIVNPKMRIPSFFLDAMVKQATLELRILLDSAVETDDFFMDDEFPSLKVKAHVLWGEQDGLFPMDYAKYLLTLLPEYEFKLFPNDAHVPHNTNPKAVLAYIYGVLESKR